MGGPRLPSPASTPSIRISPAKPSPRGWDCVTQRWYLSKLPPLRFPDLRSTLHVPAARFRKLDGPRLNQWEGGPVKLKFTGYELPGFAELVAVVIRLGCVQAVPSFRVRWLWVD
ncbi:unnamed protein product [Sphagnum balticum]